MYIQIGLQILLPVFLIVSLWRSRSRTRLEWLLNAVIAGLVLLFLFFTSRWDFVSYYLRILLWPAFILAGYAAFRKTDGDGKSTG